MGGTNYYIESLLWQILIEDPENSQENEKDFVSDERRRTQEKEEEKKEKEKEEEEEEEESDENLKIKRPRLELPETNEELHKKLSEVDPEMARRLHPNNRRKIIR